MAVCLCNGCSGGEDYLKGWTALEAWSCRVSPSTPHPPLLLLSVILITLAACLKEAQWRPHWTHLSCVFLDTLRLWVGLLLGL